MRMELIQPFINAADAVFRRSLCRRRRKSWTWRWRKMRIGAKVLRRSSPSRETLKAASFLIWSPEVAIKVASQLAGAEIEASEQVVRETVCELANMVIGNSVTLLNDQGFHFKVFPRKST